MVLFLKYIGPFLKLNCLNNENIKNQLFYLAKESIKSIVLTSGLGITMSPKQLKNKNFPTNDISTFNSISPLLCIYKKGDSKLNYIEKKLDWSNSKVKKEILISSCGYMTLNLIYLSKYYEKLEKLYPKKFCYNSLFLFLSKAQLEFYAINLRNFEGFFVDKINISDPLNSDYKFENRVKEIKISDQAIMLLSYFEYSKVSSEEDATSFYDFSMDIFNILKDYKNTFYDFSISELSKLMLIINIFYQNNSNEDVLSFLLDTSDYLISRALQYDSNKLDLMEVSMLSLNCILLYKSTNLLNYKDISQDFMGRLLALYSVDEGIFIKNSDKKEFSFSSSEILLYLINLIVYSEVFGVNESSKISNIFKHQVIESGIIGSWPEVPSLDNPERYKNFSLLAEDIIDEQNFKLSTIPNVEISNTTSVFVKNIHYNKKKNYFTAKRNSFYSEDNMFIFFLILYFFK